MFTALIPIFHPVETGIAKMFRSIALAILVYVALALPLFGSVIALCVELSQNGVL